MKNKNHHDPNIFAVDMFSLKCCFHPYMYTMLKHSKTTSPNKLFDYDCVTLYLFVCLRSRYLSTRSRMDDRSSPRPQLAGSVAVGLVLVLLLFTNVPLVT